MKKWEKILSIILLIISIFNIIELIKCSVWISSTTEWIGGLGAANIYKLGFVFALILQIISIILLAIGLKFKKKVDLFIYLAIVIIVVTYFIPIYGYPILYPYNNLYNMAIF